jgi:hypothetical protein
MTAVAIAQSIAMRTPEYRSSSRITRDVTVWVRYSTPSSGIDCSAIAMIRATTVASSLAKFRANASTSAVGRRASNAAKRIPPLSTNCSVYGESANRASHRSTT